MFKHLAVAIYAIVGGFEHFRVFVSVGVSVVLTLVFYWVANLRLIPLWPALLIILLGVIVGVLWENRSRNQRNHVSTLPRRAGS